MVTARPRALTPSWLEWAASPEALADGQARERKALVNEAAARKPWGWDYLEWRDVFVLRRIAAIHQTVFPGPHQDLLRSV